MEEAILYGNFLYYAQQGGESTKYWMATLSPEELELVGAWIKERWDALMQDSFTKAVFKFFEAVL